MASPTPSLTAEALTGDLVIDVATSGYRWTLDATRTIDWSISGGFLGEAWTSPTVVQQVVATRLAAFSAIANVQFNYVGSFADPAAAAAAGSEINVGISRDAAYFATSAAWGSAFLPVTASDVGTYAGAAGDVFFRESSPATPYYDPTGAGNFLLFHQLGHALGLKHMSDGSNGRPTWLSLDLPSLPSEFMTTQAYADNFNWYFHEFDPITPMLLDALALQALYGPNLTVNAGDNVYLINHDRLFSTVWDPSGHDRISAENSDYAWTIQLPDTTLSTLVPVRVGWVQTGSSETTDFYWLLGDIEDATGSWQIDRIIGNQLDNYIDARGGHDYAAGGGGKDTINGDWGDDQLYGGAGNDSVMGGSGLNFLRGEEGDDVIQGGDDFDDAHGNMGNDTVSGGGGDDWVVGGKDNDALYGEAGGDVVWGNLGNDTCDGGDGDDQVRGGQGDDVVRGGAGNDWLSGDRGSDTITGGAGADIFHTFDGAGLDRVTDFNAAEGDRVYLLPGTQYAVAQVGADTVITVSGAEGGTLTLVGVQMSTLPQGWIFGA